MVLKNRHFPLLVMLMILGPLAVWAATGLVGEDTISTQIAERQTESAPAPTPPPEVKAAESVVLPNGERIALDELAPGRPVAIVVMKGPWCPVCQKQLVALSERLHDVQTTGGAVFGMTTAAPAKNRALMEELGLAFPIVGDPSKDVHEKHGLWKSGCHAIPGVIFLDEEGDVKKVHRGRYPGQPQDDFILESLSQSR